MNNIKNSIISVSFMIGAIVVLVLIGLAMGEGEVSKTLTVGDTVDVGGGYLLGVQSVDAKASPKQVWFVLIRNGNKLEDRVLSLGETYNYNNVLIVRIEGIFAGATTDMVKITYSPISSSIASVSSQSTPQPDSKTPSVSKNGLVAEYHFDGDAKDSSGNGNDGTLYGATFADGFVGRALNFIDYHDVVYIPRDFLGTMSHGTIEMWFKLNQAFNPDSPSGYRSLYSTGKENDCCYFAISLRTDLRPGPFGPPGQYGLSTDPKGKIIILHGLNNDAFASNTNSWDAGVWYHMTYGWDQDTGSRKLYINGILDSSAIIGINMVDYGGTSIGGRADKQPYGTSGFNGIIDEVRVYNRALSVDEIKADYDAIESRSSQPTSSLSKSVSTPGAAAQFPASTQQPAPAAQPVAASQILEKAGSYKILLDGDTKLMDTVSMSRDAYYVVSYSNLLPYAGGIEVLSSDGRKITSESEAESVFTSIAWKEASSQLKPSDIQTLMDILQVSRDIDSSVSPVVQVTGTTVSSINSLKSACVSVPLIGKKCAWDAVAASVPGIDSVASQLDGFNTELNQWKGAASSIGTHLPNAISGIEQAKNGGEINPQLQSEISQSLSDFGTLQSKTSQMSGRLSSISSSLSGAESGLRSAAGTPVVGSLISPAASAVGNMRGQVDSLKGKTDSFSRSMGEQSAKLSSVTNAANSRTSELNSAWTTRQNAQTKVYGTFAGIGILVLVIAVVIVVKRKKNPEKEFKQEIKIEKESAFDIERQNQFLILPPEKLDPDTRRYLNQGVTIAVQKLNSEITEAEKNVALAREELNKNEDVLSKLEIRLVNKEISEETYKNLENKYKTRVTELKSKIANLESEAARLKNIYSFIQEKGKYYI